MPFNDRLFHVAMNIPLSKLDSSPCGTAQARRVFLTFGDQQLRKTLRRIRQEIQGVARTKQSHRREGHQAMVKHLLERIARP